MSLAVRAALRGNFRKEIEQERIYLGIAARRGMNREAQGLRVKLRADAQRAGLGRLSYAWKAATYPQRGGSLRARSIIQAGKGPQTAAAIEGHELGPTIRAKNVRYLAEPVGPALKLKGTDGKRISPRNFPVGRFGKLQFRPARGRGDIAGYLVVSGVRLTPKGNVGRIGARRGRKGEGIQSPTQSRNATVIMFVLRHSVKMKKRTRVRHLERQALARVPASVDAEYRRLSRRSR